MKRSYRQNCALAHALDLVGERWTLLIVRELMTGSRRYGELANNLAGIGTNLLASRLKELQTRGLIEKRDQHYELSTVGRLLEPVVLELVRFGLLLGIEDDDSRLTRPLWDVVALRALYQPDRDELPAGRYEIELNGHSFSIEKTGYDIRVSADAGDNASVSVALDKPTARSLGSGNLSLTDALAKQLVTVRGSRREARRLLRSFSLA